MNKKLFTLMLVLGLMATAIVGCGDDKESSKDAVEQSTDTGDSTVAETGTSESTESNDPGEKIGKVPAVSGSLSEKPEIATPEGDPSAGLKIEDIKKGSGKAAKAGDTVSVQYVGINWSNGEEFDASWGRGEPFEFVLGEGSVIPGWDEGVVGMKEGGRRELVIPPDMGYGAAGSPPAIPPNETLVFVVDLEKIK